MQDSLNLGSQQDSNIYDVLKIVIPILIFFAGIFFTKLINWRKEKNRLNQIDSYLKIAFENFLEGAVKQNNYYKKIIPKLSIDYRIIEIINYPQLNPEFLDVVSRKEIYNLFVQNKKGKLTDKVKFYNQLFNNLLALQDTIEYSKKMVLYLQSELCGMYNRYKTNLNIAFGFYPIFKERLGSKTGEVMTNPFLIELIKIQNTYLELSDEEKEIPSILHYKVCLPLTEMADIYNVSELVNILRNCISNFQGMESVVVTIIPIMKDYQQTFEYSNQKIIEALNYFNEKRFKFFIYYYHG